VLNRFNVLNNPINFVDPLGLFKIKCYVLLFGDRHYCNTQASLIWDNECKKLFAPNPKECGRRVQEWRKKCMKRAQKRFDRCMERCK